MNGVFGRRKSTAVDETAAYADAIRGVMTERNAAGWVTHCAVGSAVVRYGVALGPGVDPGTVRRFAEAFANRAGVDVKSVGVVGSIPGRPGEVGVTFPRAQRASVTLDEVLSSAAVAGRTEPLLWGLGRRVDSVRTIVDLALLPHVLVAGETGGGKSGAVNSLICSILLRSAPEDVKFLMIDTKRVELTFYSDIPHLMAPVATDVDEAVPTLQIAESVLDARTKAMESIGVKTIAEWNRRRADEKWARNVIVVEELADLMAKDAKEVERIVVRLCQLGRAAGIHMVLATQRPDAKTITGQITSNMPARLALRTVNGSNSRIILGDHGGAEKLLGSGDALFLGPGEPAPIRVQVGWVSDQRITEIVAEAIAKHGRRA